MARAESGEDLAAIDLWTAVHGVSGFGLGALGVSPLVVLAGVVGWELLERILEERFPGMFSAPESGINVTTDGVAMALGYLGGYRLAHGGWPTVDHLYARNHQS